MFLTCAPLARASYVQARKDLDATQQGKLYLQINYFHPLHQSLFRGTESAFARTDEPFKTFFRLHKR